MPCHAVFETQRILNKIRIPAEARPGDAKGIASATPGSFPFTLKAQVVRSLSLLYNLCCFPTTKMATVPFLGSENILPGDLSGHLWPWS